MTDGADARKVSTVAVEGAGIGVITIDNPPVNALGINVRRALRDGIAELVADETVTAIVLICNGRTFFAGADISEFGRPFEAPGLDAVCEMIENTSKPVIAAIHGTALGGGFEVALVCHYRIAVPSAKVGLPEVHLGLLPGAGGTQRLPRLVGVEAALEIIVGGKPVPAGRALELGMIDALAEEGALRRDAVDFASKIVRDNAPLARVRDRDDMVASARGHPEIYRDYLASNARAIRGFKAPFHIAKAIEAAAESPDFDTGMRRESELFEELHDSGESAAQRYYFFAERDTARVPDVPSSTPVKDISRVGIVGAGTMGGGILMNFVDIGVPVALVEMDQAALDRGLAVVRGNYEAMVRKGRITAQQLEQRMGLITPALDYDVLRSADLVIEAVFEEMSVKKDIFERLDGVCHSDAILASNTSFLDIDEMASVTKRPESVVGLHFFSPANVMRLLEVVRGAKTSKEVISTAMKLAKRIGKVPVLSRVGPGFIANRVMQPYVDAANSLALAGTAPPDIDQAIYDYGFAMGPFRTIDLVGLDVLGRGSDERTLARDLVTRGRLGQKKNGGFYDYDAHRNAVFSAAAADVIASFAQFKGIAQREPLQSEEIIARLLYPVVNEGAKVLQESLALRASDIDVAAVLGFNWPVYTGGPMFWADGIGLEKVVAGLREAGEKPAELLVEKAKAGALFSRN